MRRLVAAALLASVGLPAALEAQSLAAVAAHEAERRKHAVRGKSYTNEELLPAPAPSTSAAPQPSGTPQAVDAAKSPEGAASDSNGSPASPKTQEPPKAPRVSEAEWRVQARERRDRIQRFRNDLTLLEGRLAEVEQRAETSPAARSEQQALAGPIAELRTQLAKWEADFARFEQKAREAKIPFEWIQ